MQMMHFSYSWQNGNNGHVNSPCHSDSGVEDHSHLCPDKSETDYTCRGPELQSIQAEAHEIVSQALPYLDEIVTP